MQGKEHVGVPCAFALLCCDKCSPVLCRAVLCRAVPRWLCRDHELYQAFSAVMPTLVDLRVIKDKYTGAPR